MKTKKSILASFLVGIFQKILSLRYEKHVHGFKEIADKGRSSILFLPNHPALIDPILLMLLLYPDYSPKSLGDEYQVDKPFLRYFSDLFGVIRLPNLARRGISGIEDTQSVLQKLISTLKEGNNLLLYPSGHLKREKLESLGSASAVETLLKALPECRIVLVRQNGLWGSSFSYAYTGKAPQFIRVMIRGIGILLKNFIFLTPKRAVTYEFIEPSDFPRKADRQTINTYLENFYNTNASSNTRVSYDFRDPVKEQILPEPKPFKIEGNAEEVPSGTREVVYAKLKEMTGKKKIEDFMNLSSDLGLDSLATADLVIWIEKEFSFAVDTPESLKSVSDILLACSGLGISAREEDLNPVSSAWFNSKAPEECLSIPSGDKITDLFLLMGRKFPKSIFLADQKSGEKNYNTLLIAVFLLKTEFEKLEGNYIGVMLPASVAATTVYLALLFAGKTPVMINWTLGQRNLMHSLNLLNIKTILTARALITKLESLGGDWNIIKPHFSYLEDISKHFTLWRKSLAFFQSFFCLSTLQRARISDTAVVLFTSGSENVPKAVPLSHENLITNLRDLLNTVYLKQKDILIGMLPPFHSFGLTVNMVLPLISGLKTVYHSNPIEAAYLARLIEAYQVTLLVGTPTFLSGIMRAATEDQLKSLTMAACGAEKCPESLYKALPEKCPSIQVLEGYGITECSPIVSLNRPQKSVPFSIGPVLPSVDYVILHPEKLHPIKIGETGMLFVRGKSIFNGYLCYNGESPFIEYEGKSWYKTGDLVYENTDHLLFFSGRLKRFIKIGGEMISMPALEEVLAPYFTSDQDEGPQIAIEASTDSAHPEIILFSVKQTDRDTVNAYLKKAGFSPITYIRKIVSIPAIPILGTGKTDYRSLKALLAEKSHSE